MAIVAAILLLAACVVPPARAGAPFGTGAQPGALDFLVQVATIEMRSSGVVAKPQGFDLDHDGLREFLLRGAFERGNRLELYESNGDDAFVLEQVYDFGNTNAGPGDVGDADQDGLSDLTTVETDGGVTFHFRLYESVSPNDFPSATTPIWEMTSAGNNVAFLIADTDGDADSELVTGSRPRGGGFLHLRIFENVADDTFVETLDLPFPEFDLPQSMAVTSDLDGDGRVEILLGGDLVDPGFRVFAVESTGDDRYAEIWSGEVSIAGEPVNASRLVDGGDLDGDGKGEFLVGGLKPILQQGDPFFLVYLLFEAVGDNDFQVVSTFQQPFGDLKSNPVAEIADIDGDGRRDLIMGSGNILRAFRNVGDNLWEEFGRSSHGFLQTVGAGDHDGDGKAELIISEGGLNGFTGVWEIHPDFAADMDDDGVVDAIDNCPADGNPLQDDADQDSVGDACDNCLHGPNPDQGPAILGQTIVAVDAGSFGWPVAADVVQARGPLSGVGAYAVDQVQALPQATDFSDPTLPPPGSGFFYLVRPDCPVGSWQSELGAEPGRDAALP